MNRVCFICLLVLACATSRGPSVTIKHDSTVPAVIDTVVAVFDDHFLIVSERGETEGRISFHDGVLIPATPDKDGNYRQPVMSAGFGKGFFFFKTIYEVSVKSNRIKISKSVATEGSTDRARVPVDRELLEDLAARVRGVVVE